MRFEKIYIELSDICGLKCDFCPSKKGQRKSMELEKFDIYVKVCKAWLNYILFMF